MRIDKFLALSGLGSRSEVKKLIKSGEVKKNGAAVRSPEEKVNPECDTVTVSGKEIIYREFVYLMLNKPKGYISATEDKKIPTVLDLLPVEYLHFKPFPVGRLDIDTEGLLILTNDGALSHRLLSPKHHIPKTYYAEIDGFVTDSDKEAFLCGITLDDGYKTKPAFLNILKSDEKSEIELTITEGKFHQVKRMFKAAGKAVLYLKRIKMNGLCLDENLKIGEIKELSSDELRLLKGE